MPSTIAWQLRIRNAADSADVLSVSSVRGDTLPYIVEAPSGDGSEFDPFTGSYRSGSITVRIADGITSGTSRVVTSQLEDATFRQQLTSRPAYVERSVNGGAFEVIQAGVVTGLRLSSAAVWDIDVGDTTRSTRNLVAFAPKRNATDATKVEPLADYLARWPNRGCMAGGPILGGFLTVPDLGGWEMQVESSRSWNGGTVKRLKFRAGYTAPSFTRTANPDDVRDPLNQALGDAYGGIQTSTFPDDLGPSALRDVVVEIDGDYYAAANLAQHDGTGIAINTGQGFFLDGQPIDGFEVVDPSNALTVGSSVVRVRVYDALPSDRSPIYYTGHPLDLWTKLCDEAGLAYDSSAVTTTKNALGTSLRINLRITSSQSWASFVEQTLYGPCGFSVRTGADGTLTPFPTRITSSALPSVTVTSADVPQTGTVLFDLSEPDAITQVTINQQNLRPATSLLQQGGGSAVPRGTAGPRTAVARVSVSALDGIAVQTVQVIRTSGDSGGPVQREQTYSIPGFLDTGSGAYEPGLVDALAYQLFDRAGRGRLSGELALLRDGSAGSVVLGDEVMVSLKAMPNHNKRIGDDTSVGGRCVQIVRLTPTAWGAQAKFIDSGPNANAASPLPTLSLADGPAGAGLALTVTNAATLNAAGIAVRVQWAQVASGTPASSAYADVLYFPAGAVPTGATLLPMATPGYTVYVRARSEQAGKRPSAYSTASSRATGAMGAPTGLSVTPSGTDGSKATVAWTIGTNASLARTDIYLRLSTLAFADAIRMAAGLLPGTISYPLTELIPGDAYIVTVLHRDPVSGATTKAEFTFTAGSTTRTLNPPTNPVGIVGNTDPTTGVGHLDGTYGLNVTAAELPGYVTFWEALETGYLTGTYGSFTQVSGLVPSVSGGPTTWRSVSANNLLRRQLKARHEAEGTNPSTYTSPVTLDSWGVVVSPPIPGGGDTYNQCLAVITDSDDTTVTVTVTGSAPSGTPTVQLVAVTSPAAVVSGAAIGSPVASGSVWVFSKGAYLAGDGGAQFRAVFAGNVSDDDFVTIPERAPDVAVGQQILPNPNFAGGVTGYAAYDNNASGHVTLSTVTDATAPNASGKLLRVSVASATTPNVTVAPGFGGFYVGISADSGVYVSNTYHRGALITWRVRAKIPVGYTLAFASNAYGTGGTLTNLTPMVGTGDWFDYKFLQQIGTSGTFSSTGFFWVDGPGTGPFTWDVAQVTANDAHQTPREAVRLTSRARVIATTATTVTVRYAVADPFPSGSADVTIGYNALGTGGVTPATGGTVTPHTTLDEAAGTYIDYTITRPAFTAGTGRVTFDATRTGYTSDSDSVDIPAQEKTSFGPSLTVTASTSGGFTTIVYTGTGTIELSIDNGAWGTPSASPITVAQDSSSHTYAFRATLDGQTVPGSADVPALQPTGSLVTFGSMASPANNTTNTYAFSWTCSDASVPLVLNVDEDDGNGYQQVFLSAGATSWTYSSVWDLTTGAPNFTMTWYLQATSGDTVRGTSVVKSFPAHHA